MDLTDKGYKTSLIPFEIISNGHIMKQTKCDIEKAMNEFGIKLSPSIYKNLACKNITNVHNEHFPCVSNHGVG